MNSHEFKATDDGGFQDDVFVVEHVVNDFSCLLSPRGTSLEFSSIQSKRRRGKMKED